jgi:hypothetical protein
MSFFQRALVAAFIFFCAREGPFVLGQFTPLPVCLNPFGELGYSRCWTYMRNQQIAGSKVSIHHFNNFTEDITPWLELVKETVQTTVPLYAELLGPSRPLNLKILLQEWPTEKGDDDYRGSSWVRDAASTDTCYIEVYTKNYHWREVTEEKNLKVPSKEGFQNALAHELYHCVQMRCGLYRDPVEENRQRELSKWWYEGSADYFAGYLYPTKPEDRLLPYMFNWPDWPLVGRQLTRPSIGNDKGGLFFLYLSNIGWTNLRIHNWVTSQRFGQDPFAEYRRPAFDPQFVDVWPDFATKFADGQIYHTDNTSIFDQYSMYHKHMLTFEAALDYHIDHSGFLDVPIHANLFTVELTRFVTFSPGKAYTATLRVSEQDLGFTVKWKKDGDASWQNFVAGQTLVLRGGSGSETNMTFNFLPLSTRFALRPTDEGLAPPTYTGTIRFTK